uniref:B30.2/SPRY domain-containing protein n=1 Tax=Sinocyclocheilus rhinocerous TaxID=307959 RepID=A0A673KBJ6_9TELE
GSTVIVPCWISPPENAEALEIRWYRHDQFSNPVLLYNHGKLQDVQEEPYRNRTSLALRSDQSEDIQNHNIIRQCFKQYTYYPACSFCVRRRSEHLSLLLSSALGSAPVLFPKPLDDGRVNISCRSRGWYPEPSVSWTSDDGRAFRPGGSSHSRGADEMFSVHTRVYTGVPLVERSVAMQLCPDTASTQQGKPCLPSRVCRYSSALSGDAFVAYGEAASALHATALLQVLQAKALRALHEGGHDPEVLKELRTATVLALQATKVTACSLGRAMSTLVVQERHLWLCLADMRDADKFGSSRFQCPRPASSATQSRMWPSSSRLHRSRLRRSDMSCPVEITIDREHSHPDLKVSKDCKTVRDSEDYQHTGEGFPFQLCAFGAQRFTSGRHYWEVELAHSPNPPKNFWIIGVVKHGHFTARDRSALTPSNGFWFLCSDGPHGFYTNTEPSIRFSLTPRPERLGVLFDYDDGLLSFYNVKESTHLLTISSRFSESVVPLFNPGAGDPSPLRILDCPKPAELTPEEDDARLIFNENVYPYVFMVKDYNDIIYNNINC